MLLNTLVPCLLLASVCGEVQLRLGKMKVTLDNDKPLVTVKACGQPSCLGNVILWYPSEERDPTPEYNKNDKCQFRLPGGVVDRQKCISVGIQEHGTADGQSVFAKCTPTVTDGKIKIEVAELPTQCNVTITNGIELENGETEETSTTLIWALVAVGIAVALIIIVTVAVTVILCVRKKRRSTKGTTTTAPPKPALSLPPMTPVPTPPPLVRKPVPTPKLPPIPPLPAKKSEDGPRRKPWIEKPPSPPSPALMLSTTQRDDDGSARRGVIVTADPSTELDTRPISPCQTSPPHASHRRTPEAAWTKRQETEKDAERMNSEKETQNSKIPLKVELEERQKVRRMRQRKRWRRSSSAIDGTARNRGEEEAEAGVPRHDAAVFPRQRPSGDCFHAGKHR